MRRLCTAILWARGTFCDVHFNKGSFSILFIRCKKRMHTAITINAKSLNSLFIRIFHFENHWMDRLCGLVVRVRGYSSRGPGFDSRRYQIFWEVVGLERDPLSLLRKTEELLEWKSSGSGQENRINGPGGPLRWPCDTLCPQKLTLTSPINGGRSVGIIRLRTKGYEFSVSLESLNEFWKKKNSLVRTIMTMEVNSNF
jgi:hypothetical protein